MKKLFLILILLSGCADNNSGSSTISNACAASPFAGTWGSLNTTETLILGGDCRGSSDLCASNFLYPNVTAAQGNVIINVLSTNNFPGCLPLGETLCSYTTWVSGGLYLLDITCGGNTLNYGRVL